MCGIAGFVNRAGQAADRAIVERMTATLAHRGPGRRRLLLRRPGRARASPALDHRRRPAAPSRCRNEDGSVWVTYNGELYNELELRTELEAKGHRYRTVLRHREPGPPLRGGGARLRSPAQRDVRAGDLGRQARPAGSGARPDGPEAALLRRAARRRPGLRLGAEGAAGPSRDRPRARLTRAWPATSSTNTSPPPTRSGSRCRSFPAATPCPGNEARSGSGATGIRPSRAPRGARLRGGGRAVLGRVPRLGGAAPAVGRAASASSSRAGSIRRAWPPRSARSSRRGTSARSRSASRTRASTRAATPAPSPATWGPTITSGPSRSRRSTSCCPRSPPGSTSRSATPRSCRLTC